jgi:hypothetical protein
MREGLRRIDIGQRLVQFKNLHNPPVVFVPELSRSVTPSRNTLQSEGGNITGDAYFAPPEETTVWVKKSDSQLAKNERHALPIRELKELQREQRAVVREAEKLLRKSNRDT